eukprot:CAMPEP_0177590500 /NCGR_PEP_ID=MMETSP0419_2-20121207/7445_1 /TAXON_ID=582737 /ORGANISM="Tetraselmis sp., Strain GSL018" /LENGTH=197 /DNA_ID=CAMNT_0019081075 /DNA_START=234 /DNA_END=826 /DNA_ORIENTATION=+
MLGSLGAPPDVIRFAGGISLAASAAWLIPNVRELHGCVRDGSLSCFPRWCCQHPLTDGISAAQLVAVLAFQLPNLTGGRMRAFRNRCLIPAAASAPVDCRFDPPLSASCWWPSAWMLLWEGRRDGLRPLPGTPTARSVPPPEPRRHRDEVVPRHRRPRLWPAPLRPGALLEDPRRGAPRPLSPAASLELFHRLLPAA